jgi:hypothetical protein
MVHSRAKSLIRLVLRLLTFANTVPARLRGALTVLAGAIAVPAAVPMPAGSLAVPPAPLATPAPPPSLGAASPFRSDECLASTICSVKAHVRWRTPAWTPEFCRDIAAGVAAAAKKYDLSPSLVLAVMVNESDMDEKAARVTMRGDRVYAKDSGLMGIRCVLDRRGRCLNGHVRGMPWRTLMDPLTNIDVGAHELSRWRRDGVTRVVVRTRDARGRLVVREKKIRCQHKTHAFWAHYNHGPVYIDHGPARHYPHRVAVLDYALARDLEIEAPELDTRITIRDPGQRPRTPDRPVEPRLRKLCAQIQEAGGACSRVATSSGARPR